MKYLAVCPACETRLPVSWVAHHHSTIELCPGCRNEIRRANDWLYRGHQAIAVAQLACVVGGTIAGGVGFRGIIGGFIGMAVGIGFAIDIGEVLFPFVSPYVVAEAYCVRCGYSLTGNVSGVCPECGKIVSRAR